MRHEHKSGAWVELADDLTFRQLEQYEAAARGVLDNAEKLTDAALARAAVEGALACGLITAGEGVPSRASEIDTAPAAVLWWLARKISQAIMDIKTLDPE